MASPALTQPLQDKIAQVKGKEHRQRDLARQEQLRAMLDSQMQDVERQRQAEAQQRREVSLLLANGLHQVGKLVPGQPAG